MDRANGARDVRESLMLYGLIPLMASIILAIRYVTLGEPSRWSKIIVISAVVASFFMSRAFPELIYGDAFVQAAVSLTVVVRMKLNPDAA